MRALLGFGILAAGVFLGAAIFRQPEEPFGSGGETVVAAVVQPTDKAAEPPPPIMSAGRSFSPRLPGFGGVSATSPRAEPPPVAAGVGPVATVVPAAPVVPAAGPPDAASPLASPPVVVTVAGGGKGAVKAVKPSDEAARRELVRNLQQELKRTGCYDGVVSGDWTPNTKRALAALVGRVNSSLPVEEPDYILLALARSQHGQVCGKACGPEEGVATDGRCLPKAVLAHEANRRAKPGDKRAEPPLMAEVPPAIAVVPSPAQQRAPEPPSAVVVAPAPTEPLPGRMAIGARVDGGAPLAPYAPVTAPPPAAAAATAPPPAAVGPQKRPRETREYRPQQSTGRSLVESLANPVNRN